MDLNIILENHKHWLKEDVDGWKNMRANLCRENLQEVYLCDADLSRAYLHRADLYKANLSGANLYRSDLRETDLHLATLYRANLFEANLSGAYLCSADLRRANLREANLYGANLSGADLYGVDLYGANLREANLRRAKNVPFIPFAFPSDGDFIAWKKADNCLVKLLIPEDAKKTSATTNKCRCNKAKVLAITTLDEKQSMDYVRSDYDKYFIYKVGEWVEVDDFDGDRWNECSTGIHFFINKQEAINYH